MAEEILTIFLITHNRPNEALLAISSILGQSNKRFQLIISDNSDNDELSWLIKERLPHLRYWKRPASINAFEHFNLCISEVTTKYFSLFHDDDLMLPNFVQSFWDAQKNFPDAIAFGGNAIIERDSSHEGLSFKFKKKYRIINSADYLLKNYFSRHQLGISPFPSYVYLRLQNGGVRFSSDLGKYADVEFLLKIAQRGAIIWINEPVMIYRMHESNDSKTESIRDRLRFMGFLKLNRQYFDSLVLIHYRRFLYKKYISTDSSRAVTKRIDLMKKYLVHSQCNFIFIKENLGALMRKIGIKLQMFLF